MARGEDEDPSRLEAAASRFVGKLVDVGIDGLGPLDSAASVADAAKRRHRRVDDAIDDLVSSHKKLAAGNGFVTGFGGLITLPVALPANVAAFYIIATRMVAGIAHLRGYDVSRPEVRSAVLLTLVGADTSSVLSKAGLNPAGRVTGLALKRLPAPALMVLNKGIGFRLLSQIGSRGLRRFGRAIPLVGGFVGAGLDWWLLRRIADNAESDFPRGAEVTAG